MQVTTLGPIKVKIHYNRADTILPSELVEVGNGQVMISYSLHDVEVHMYMASVRNHSDLNPTFSMSLVGSRLYKQAAVHHDGLPVVTMNGRIFPRPSEFRGEINVTSPIQQVYIKDKQGAFGAFKVALKDEVYFIPLEMRKP